MLKIFPLFIFNQCLTTVKLSLYPWVANPSQTIGSLTMYQSKNPKITKQDTPLAVESKLLIINTSKSMPFQITESK
jgi:hypothetical protein